MKVVIFVANFGKFVLAVNKTPYSGGQTYKSEIIREGQKEKPKTLLFL